MYGKQEGMLESIEPLPNSCQCSHGAVKFSEVVGKRL